MKRPLLLFLCILLFACDEDQKQPDDLINTDTVPSFSGSVSTDVEIIPLRQLPAGFKLDSLIKTDTASGHSITLYYPVSESDKGWNKKLKSYIQDYVKGYYPEKNRGEDAHSVFDMWVVSYKDNEKKIHFKFMMQSFYSGGAHYNQDSTYFVYSKKINNPGPSSDSSF